MLREDNNGFVNFPLRRSDIAKMDCGKTIIYLAAFDERDTHSRYDLSNIKMELQGCFVSDDVCQREFTSSKMTIDDVVQNQIMNDEYDSVYFPEIRSGGVSSIPMTSCICIGWSDFSFERKDRIGFWNATFDDLTSEGKKLYYSLKKLHNRKDLRILTFNNI